MRAQVIAGNSNRRLTKIEFGDFQTPAELASLICQQLAAGGLHPNTILEPTCGQGSLLLAAADRFPASNRLVGIDINVGHLKKLASIVDRRADQSRFTLHRRDIFTFDIESISSGLPEPWLLIGNPPWVTSSTLGAIDRDNLPAKSNLDDRRGIDAITGQANFDVSEWILRQVLKWLDGRHATMAMLCKTSVARKLLRIVWQDRLQVHRASIHTIDSAETFDAAVEACLFVCDFSPGGTMTDAGVFASIGSPAAVSRVGWQSGKLIADQERFERWQHLQTGVRDLKYVWRSGVKHDCAEVMELRKVNGTYWNHLGEAVEIERRHVYPLLKSSDLSNRTVSKPRYGLVLPQRHLAEDTLELARSAPRTWDYLNAHAQRLDSRRSSIYRNRPRFCVFGVGDYTFAPWKVAISGFYKRLIFSVVGSVGKRPILLDDTCYFLACSEQEEAERLAAALNSDIAREFFSAFIFWDAKRPITAALLNQLDIPKLLRLVSES